MALFVSFLYLRLPDINELRNVKYQQPLRIHTADGALISQIGQIKRTPIDYQDTPQYLINALLSAEDARFFQHIGLDFRGLARAVIQLVTNSPTQTGGSTITMQVARNYYLTRERTILRKLNEILLAIKMERFIDKEEIMSLYVNTIFLGFKSYGFAAAAQAYYNKDIGELSLAQYAMLAALPKAPSALNPISNPERARERRDWILMRMARLGYISRAQYLDAVEVELSASPFDYTTEVEGLFFSESVRLAVLKNSAKYNVTEEEFYTAGYKIYTTADRDMQEYANKAIRNGLLAYDKRHGWRGPEKVFESLSTPEDFNEENEAYNNALRELTEMSSYDNSLEPVIVKSINEQAIEVVLSNGGGKIIEWAGLEWAAPYINDQTIGNPPTKAEEIVNIGDLIRISRDGDNYRISQIPRAEGALLAVDPNNGFVRAMVGGYHFQLTKYNRALQARRQIGSAIKPFLYTAALARGYNGADVFNDAPFVAKSSTNLVWRPSNAGDTFLGYIPMREGLYRSRNLVSVRLMQDLGISRVRNYMAKFALPLEHLPDNLSLSLGSAELTLLEVARAYSVFANGGYLVEPRLILKIEDADGNIIYEAETREISNNQYVSQQCVACANQKLIDNLAEDEFAALRCNNCLLVQNSESTISDEEAPPYPRVVSPQVHYQINSILRDVMSRGTGIRSSVLGRGDFGGKTGTTQKFVDAWFSGYNPELVAVTWVGFDNPSSLGPIEYGGVTALPMWIEFMGQALRGKPERHFVRPKDLVEAEILINSESGLREFTEYININHIKDYIKRVNKNSVYVDSYYNWRDSDELRNIDIEEELEKTTEKDKNRQIKDLF